MVVEVVVVAPEVVMLERSLELGSGVAEEMVVA